LNLSRDIRIGIERSAAIGWLQHLVAGLHDDPGAAGHAADVLIAIKTSGQISVEACAWLLEVKHQPGQYETKRYAARILRDLCLE